MKKLFIIAAATIALASCGNKTSQNTEGADSTVVGNEMNVEATADSITAALDEQLTAGDATTVESTLAAAQAKYEELVKAGKTEEAKAYASKLKAFYEKNASTIKNVASGNTTITDLVNGIVNLPTTVEEGATEVKDAAVSDANAAVNGVKDAATETVNAAKQTAKQTVDDAKQKAKDEVKAAKENAKQKASDAANKAVNNALNKAFGN